MNELGKKFLFTGLTLGLIAGISAGLVGVVNAVTAPVITRNNEQNAKGGLVQIYGGSAEDYAEDETVKGYIDDSLLKYVTGVYTFQGEGENKGLKVIAGEGKNTYGEIGLYIGVSADGNELGKMVVVKNTESFGPKIQSNYISRYDAATTPEERRAVLDETSGFGATYGATLIRNIVSEGISAIQGKVASDPNAIDEGGKGLLGEDVETSRYNALNQRYLAFAYTYLKKGWSVVSGNNGETLGRVYQAVGTTGVEDKFSTSIVMDIGIKANGELGQIYVVNNSDPTFGPIAQEGYVDLLNASTTKLDDVNYYLETGATASSSLMSQMIKEAYKAATGQDIEGDGKGRKTPVTPDGLEDDDKTLFTDGDKATYVTIDLGDLDSAKPLTNAWTVKNSIGERQGYLYKGKVNYDEEEAVGSMVVDVAIDTKGNVFKVLITNYLKSNKSFIKEAQTYLDGYDWSTGLDGVGASGAGGTVSREAAKTVIEKALADVEGRMN